MWEDCEINMNETYTLDGKNVTMRTNGPYLYADLKGQFAGKLNHLWFTLDRDEARKLSDSLNRYILSDDARTCDEVIQEHQDRKRCFECSKLGHKTKEHDFFVAIEASASTEIDKLFSH